MDLILGAIKTGLNTSCQWTNINKSFNNPNILNFISILTLLSLYLLVDESNRYYTYNISLLANDYYSFYVFDYFSISIKKNDLNFDEYIRNYKAISHASTSDRLKEKSNVENDFNDNIDEFVVEHISKKFQKIELLLSIFTIIYEIKSIVRKIFGKKTENERSRVFPEISEPKIIAVKILFLMIYKDIADSNWYISFIVLMEKKLLYFHLTQI